MDNPEVMDSMAACRRAASYASRWSRFATRTVLASVDLFLPPLEEGAAAAGGAAKSTWTHPRAQCSTKQADVRQGSRVPKQGAQQKQGEIGEEQVHIERRQTSHNSWAEGITAHAPAVTKTTTHTHLLQALETCLRARATVKRERRGYIRARRTLQWGHVFSILAHSAMHSKQK